MDSSGETSLALAPILPLPVSSRPPGTLLHSNAAFTGPGRTLHELYSTLGGTAEKHANRAAHNLGLGPVAVSERIGLFFGDGSERETALLQLKADGPARKLEKDCVRLMKYALPTESANTQLESFKNIVALTTRYPGVRHLFLRCEYLEGVEILEKDIACAWDRSDDACGPHWHFHRNFASACVADQDIATMVEDVSPPNLGSVANRPEGLSVIERLLVASDCDGNSTHSQAIAVRYLGGILALPSFWLQTGTMYRAVVQKLLDRTALLLKDLGVDSEGLESSSDVPSDVEGVDLLCEALLTGMQAWFPERASPATTREFWYPSLSSVLQLLRQPKSEELLPKSWAIATAEKLRVLVPSQYEVRFVDTLSVTEQPSDQVDPRSHRAPPRARRKTSTKKTPKDDTVAAVPSGTIFGQPLRENLKYSSLQISTANADGELFVWGYVPLVVAKCGLYLKENATEVPGTFRVNGSEERMRELQVQLETPPRYGKHLDWKQEPYTTHDVASVLRRYLTQMPEPLIPPEIYPTLRDALVKRPFDQDEAIETYKRSIRAMPRANQYLLLYVLDLFSVFAHKSEVNLMTAPDLAGIFRPGIISHPARQVSTAEQILSERVLQFLIAQQDWFMEAVPPPQPRNPLPELPNETTSVPKRARIVKRGGEEGSNGDKIRTRRKLFAFFTARSS
ncbi:hypothetical protein FB451DRAFT_1203270 [Mycena latifolia]|nr:hypothetical protein FB451DRAFT_1203270 [Mycena latifolia]